MTPADPIATSPVARRTSPENPFAVSPVWIVTSPDLREVADKDFSLDWEAIVREPESPL
jgi:hypothetical protein